MTQSEKSTIEKFDINQISGHSRLVSQSFKGLWFVIVVNGNNVFLGGPWDFFRCSIWSSQKKKSAPHHVASQVFHNTSRDQTSVFFSSSLTWGNIAAFCAQSKALLPCCFCVASSAFILLILFCFASFLTPQLTYVDSLCTDQQSGRGQSV